MIVLKRIPGKGMRGLCNPGFVGKRMSLGMIVLPNDGRTVWGIDKKRKNLKPVDMSNGPFGYDEGTPGKCAFFDVVSDDRANMIYSSDKRDYFSP